MPPLALRMARHDEDVTVGRDHGSEAITRLRPLLASAGRLDLRDREGWVRLRHTARVTTADLVTEGALPEHLTVEADDSPVLIARTIAAAWRHATSAP